MYLEMSSKYLANVPKEAIVREADLMSELQYGVRYLDALPTSCMQEAAGRILKGTLIYLWKAL